MAEKMREIELPERVVERIESRVSHTEFDSTSEYITNVLNEVLYHVEDEVDLGDTERINEEQVQDRLRDLGYIDV